MAQLATKRLEKFFAVKEFMLFHHLFEQGKRAAEDECSRLDGKQATGICWIRLRSNRTSGLQSATRQGNHAVNHLLHRFLELLSEIVTNGVRVGAIF